MVRTHIHLTKADHKASSIEEIGGKASPLMGRTPEYCDGHFCNKLSCTKINLEQHGKCKGEREDKSINPISERLSTGLPMANFSSFNSYLLRKDLINSILPSLITSLCLFSSNMYHSLNYIDFDMFIVSPKWNRSSYLSCSLLCVLYSDQYYLIHTLLTSTY